MKTKQVVLPCSRHSRTVSVVSLPNISQSHDLASSGVDYTVATQRCGIVSKSAFGTYLFPDLSKIGTRK